MKYRKKNRNCQSKIWLDKLWSIDIIIILNPFFHTNFDDFVISLLYYFLPSLRQTPDRARDRRRYPVLSRPYKHPELRFLPE
jgi:hypothetical protein